MLRTLVIACLIVLAGCVEYQREENLPVMGPKETEKKMVGGKEVVDTVYHTIPSFSFIDQDSNRVTEKTFDGKIYVADFFFTSCPTICPTMTKNMLKVHDAFKEREDIKLLSHSIDTRHDSVPVLKNYASKLEVGSDKWHFVTGNRDDIYGIANSYLASAGEDKDAPGGYVHSGALILIDKEKRIRGYYDGTKDQEVQKLIRHIKVLAKPGKK